MRHLASSVRKAANSAIKHLRQLLRLLPVLALITAFPQQMQAKELGFFNYRSVFDSKESFEAAKKEIREILERSKDIQYAIKSEPKLRQVVDGNGSVRDSALAMCINWVNFFYIVRVGRDPSRAIKSWGWSYRNGSDSQARRNAIKWCKKSGANAGCDCETLLVNGRIVITENAGLAWKSHKVSEKPKSTEKSVYDQLDFSGKTKKSSPSDTPNLSVVSCKAATKKDASGKLVWNTNPSVAPLVEELKNSKIFCGVSAETTNNNAQTNDKLSEQFMALKEIDRRKDRKSVV